MDILETLDKITSDETKIDIGTAASVTIETILMDGKDVLNACGVESEDDQSAIMGAFSYHIARSLYSLKFVMKHDKKGFEEFMKATDLEEVIKNDNEIRHWAEGKMPKA